MFLFLVDELRLRKQKLHCFLSKYTYWKVRVEIQSNVNIEKYHTAYRPILNLNVFHNFLFENIHKDQAIIPNHFAEVWKKNDFIFGRPISFRVISSSLTFIIWTVCMYEWFFFIYGCMRGHYYRKHAVLRMWGKSDDSLWLCVVPCQRQCVLCEKEMYYSCLYVLSSSFALIYGILYIASSK